MQLLKKKWQDSYGLTDSRILLTIYLTDWMTLVCKHYWKKIHGTKLDMEDVQGRELVLQSFWNISKKSKLF